MFDPYQAASIESSLVYKKKKKQKRAFKQAIVGMIVGVAGAYIANILNNLIEKKKFNEIFKVTSSWQIFYASVVAGGINGVLVVYLPPKLYRFASVIVIAVLFEIINGISNNTYSTNYTFVSNIVRDIFLIFFIIDLYKKLFKDYTKNKKNDSIDEIEFDELLGVTLLSSIVLNIGIVTTRTGINSILNL